MRDKKKEPKRPQKNKKEKRKINREKSNKKREGGNTTIPFKDPHSYFIAILVLHRDYHSCITMWGPLHYRTWLVYSNDEPPQMSSRSS